MGLMERSTKKLSSSSSSSSSVFLKLPPNIKKDDYSGISIFLRDDILSNLLASYLSVMRRLIPRMSLILKPWQRKREKFICRKKLSVKQRENRDAVRSTEINMKRSWKNMRGKGCLASIIHTNTHAHHLLVSSINFFEKVVYCIMVYCAL